MMGPSEAMLQDIRVLDLTEERGLYAGKLMASLGADVIKVEPPGGSRARLKPPFKDDIRDREGSLYFISLNSGKRSITLNLSSDTGRSLFSKLVERADVLLEDFDPPERESLGLDYGVLKELNPRLVVGSISAFGKTGPYKDYKAPDIVSYAMGGLMYVSGPPSRPPVVAPGEQAYHSTSLMTVFGIMTALYARLNTGEGQLVESSTHETMATINEELIMRYSLTREIKQRSGSQHTSAPARIYPCKDGHVHIVVLRPHHWRSLLDVLGKPELLMDRAWYDPRFRRLNVDLIDPLVIEFTLGYSTMELCRLFQEKGIPCTPVNTPADFVNDPHVRERNFVVEIDHPSIGRHRDLAPPFESSELAKRQNRPAPLLGQSNVEIYCNELGHEMADLAGLKEQGII